MLILTKRNKILIFCFIISLSIINAEFLIDSEEAANHRLLWNKSKEKEITGGRVSFTQNDEQGTFCQSESESFSHEYLFKISSKYLLCGFDLYPFKFEMIKLLNKIYDNKYGKTGDIRNAYKTKQLTHMFTIYLIYLEYKKKDKVLEEAIKQNKPYYNIHPTNEQLEYLESLPKVIYTKEMYDATEYKLFEYSGNMLEVINDIKETHESLVYELEHYKALGPIMLPFLKDYNNYRYWYSIIASRAYRVVLVEYEKMHNFNFEKDTPNGQEHKELLKYLTQDFAYTCLIPFFDLCNHKGQESNDENQIDFTLSFDRGFVSSALGKKFVKNEEYAYSYMPHASNEKLLFSYGFYLNNNINSKTTFKIPMWKPFLNREKNDIIVKYKLLDYPIDNFFNTGHSHILIQHSLNKFALNERLLTLMKLYTEPIESYNPKKFETRIKNKQWQSYQSEISSLIALKSIIDKNSKESKLTYKIILQSLVLTRNYFKKNRESIISKPLMRFKYRLRRRIMEVIRESKEIFETNRIMAMKSMKTLLADQLGKLKTYYLNN